MATAFRHFFCTMIGAIALVGCNRSMGKIDAVYDALAKDDESAITSALEGYPACADAPPLALLPTQASPRDTGCFAEIASALGSKKGFQAAPPDQAAATAIAIVVLRDGRGDWVAHPESWLGAMKTGRGPGPDALRMAVARKMASAAPLVGRNLDAEKDAKAALVAIAGAIPGACPTYWLLGSGTDPATLPTEQSAEHSACVQKDLQRREGPGGSYGDGTVRALEGSLALWRDAERSLRMGLGNVGPAGKPTLERKLRTIESATQAIATTKLATNNAVPALVMLGDVHADAGVILWKDAGAKDGGADAAP